jgi:ribosome biogenesis protein Nip4
MSSLTNNEDEKGSEKFVDAFNSFQQLLEIEIYIKWGKKMQFNFERFISWYYNYSNH